jgi:valyl-tRNA synthetase
MALRQLEKTYDPKQVEARWYRFWIDQHYFHAALDHPGEPFTIVIPPPNITGSLHIGHALNNTLQDILIRWRRMQGRNALWVPGTDHAGIATQNVVERQLMAEGSSRDALGREAFIARVWDWKERSGGTILQQLERLGASCDWDRLRFTMDEGLSKAVREVFVRLYDEGLIYRGERLINWCPRCLTALSDIEVEHEETKGKLYHIRYPLADDPATSLIVATTRPETMLGDTAVAVHPEDPRYRDLIGKKVLLPLTTREIPIVGDPLLVDREFGTGAVKITPAHDFNDFLAGERHHLPRLAILDAHARLDPEGLRKASVEPAVSETVQGLPVGKARLKIEEQLQARGWLVKVDDHQMALGKCYRCKTVVEPYLSPQWFVNIQPLADPAIKAVEDGRIRIIPETWSNNYLGWMRDIKDWCISRQIWWGHRIPAWYCRQCNEDSTISTAASTGRRSYSFSAKAKPIVSRTAPTHCADCGQHDFLQESDVLDTWFSSALWPFSTLGWPDQTAEIKKFYPTSTLVTGLDILFFWVARMIMMGLKFMGDVPFREVYIHALVRDAEGQKMSKSKGNVIDPLSIMDTYGTDALRFTLASMASPGRDIKLAEERIEGYRNFANKMWNAARFILMHAEGPRERPTSHARSFADRWMLSRLNYAIRDTTAALEQYRFDHAAGYLYQFIWHEYCDWYLELVKPALQDKDSTEARHTRATLLESFEIMLRLLHPFMPFVTEEIWQALPREAAQASIMIRPFPVPESDWEAKEIEEQFGVLERFVTVARAGRALLAYPPGTRLTLFGVAHEAHARTTLEILHPHLEQLSRASVRITAQENWPSEKVLRLVTEGLTMGIAVEGDVDLQKILDRIVKQGAEAMKEVTRLQGKLRNAEFVAKAPPEVVTEHRQRINTLTHEHSLLAGSEEQLRRML